MQLVSAGLGASGTSKVWEVVSGLCNVQVVGTFDSETVTLHVSPTAKTIPGNFTDYAAMDASGTVGTVTFTENETKVIAGAGQFFYATTSGGGGSPSVSVYVGPFNKDSVVRVHD